VANEFGLSLGIGPNGSKQKSPEHRFRNVFSSRRNAESYERLPLNAVASSRNLAAGKICTLWSVDREQLKQQDKTDLSATEDRQKTNVKLWKFCP
jgi:hypothetical protein